MFLRIYPFSAKASGFLPESFEECLASVRPDMSSGRFLSMRISDSHVRRVCRIRKSLYSKPSDGTSEGTGEHGQHVGLAHGGCLGNLFCHFVDFHRTVCQHGNGVVTSVDFHFLCFKVSHNGLLPVLD